MFCFAIGLGVVGGGQGEVIVQEFSKLLGEGRGELWTMIRDDLVVEPEVEVYFMKEKGDYPFGSDRFLSGAENYPLHKAMVDHDQQRIEAGGKGEVSDEVTRDLLEGARCMGFDRGERGNSGVHVGLILLAQGTAFNVLLHELCETWPPEFRGDELVGFEISWVTGGFMIMASSKNRVVERVLWGDVDTIFVGQDMVIESPV